MQIKKLVPPLTGQWMAVYKRERPNLSPNAVTGEELCEYVRTRLHAEPWADETALDAVKKDVENSTFFAKKLCGAEPQPAAFRLPDGSFVGIDLVSGWFIAENDKVREELTYVKGLDEDDLENPIRTVEWLRCRKAAERNGTRKKRSVISVRPTRTDRDQDIRGEQN